MAHRYVWDHVADYDPAVRAADADRERVAERLRTSHAEGRLDLTEFQERLDRCLEARTLGELDDLVGDLPRDREQPERRSSRALRMWRLAPWAPILIAVIAVSAATGHHAFWLWMPLLFILMRVTWWQRRRWAGAGRSWHGWT